MLIHQSAEYNQNLLENRRLLFGGRDEKREGLMKDLDSTRIDKRIYDALSKEEGYIPSDMMVAEVKGFVHYDSGHYYYVYVEEL